MPFGSPDRERFEFEHGWDRPVPGRRGRPWINTLLLLLTIGTTTLMGALHYAAFRAGFTLAVPALSPSTADEHRRHAAAEMRKAVRREMAQRFEALRGG